MTGADTGVSGQQRVLAGLADVRRRADAQLAEFFELVQREDEEAGGPSAYGLAQLRAVALAGGKRLRPAFTQWAYVAAGGDPADDRAIHAGSIFELLHVFALIHDDVMDGSDTRRSMPTLHVSFAERHAALRMHGSAQRYGENMAILLGDFTLILCTRLAGSLPPRAVHAFYHAATKLMYGQYLDLETSALGRPDGTATTRTALLKTASYTVEGPLLVGAALARHGPELEPHLRAYARATGMAFQHRDDLLDLFGDSAETGKPVGGDVVRHKATRLLELAWRRAAGDDRVLLRRLEDGGLDVGEARALLERCGAVAEMERHIERLVAEASAAVANAPMTRSGRETLIDAAVFAGERRW